MFPREARGQFWSSRERSDSWPWELSPLLARKCRGWLRLFSLRSRWCQHLSKHFGLVMVFVLWVNSATHTVLPSLERGSQIFYWHSKYHFPCPILASLNTWPVFFYFESLPKPVVKSIIIKSKWRLCLSWTVFRYLFQSKDWKGRKWKNLRIKWKKLWKCPVELQGKERWGRPPGENRKTGEEWL